MSDGQGAETRPVRLGGCQGSDLALVGDWDGARRERRGHPAGAEVCLGARPHVATLAIGSGAGLGLSVDRHRRRRLEHLGRADLLQDARGRRVDVDVRRRVLAPPFFLCKIKGNDSRWSELRPSTLERAKTRKTSLTFSVRVELVDDMVELAKVVAVVEARRVLLRHAS